MRNTEFYNTNKIFFVGEDINVFPGREPETVHGAEADCLTLLKAVAVCSSSFASWLRDSTNKFQDVKKL
jgi:hypothetical protein